jgi:hypothetical protein
MGPLQYETRVPTFQLPNVAVDKLIFLFLIREVPGTNPGQEAGYPNRFIVALPPFQFISLNQPAT